MRERRVQFDVGQISGPDQGGQVLHEAILHFAFVVFAPDFRRLHPVGRCEGQFFS